jgi:hypothetical protein
MRIQLELSDDRVKELKELMQRVDLETYKDLFNNALMLFEWSVEEAEEGRVVASIDPEQDRYRELAMPLLDRIIKRRNAALRIAAASTTPQPHGAILPVPR